MTVAAATAKAGPYTGNDSASSFAFSFKVFADADIRVVKTVIASGAESDLVLNTNYTVTRNADQDTNPGGSVTYKVSGVTTALPSTLKLTIVGDFDYSQPTDIPNGGSFFASIIETALDRVTMLIKQLKERVDSALTLPVSVTGVSAELPTPEAGTVLGWNTAADALVNLDAASLAGSVAAVDWIAETFDGTGAQVDFTLTRDPGVAANCDVSISGVTQVPGTDFTVSSTTLTFTTAPASGTDNICVRYGSALPSASSVAVDGVATASIQDDAVTVAKIADAELKALAGLTSAANKVPMFSGSGTATLLDFKDEDNMASDSATAVPSQQSVKAYVDTEITDAIAALPAAILSASYDSGDLTIALTGTHALTHSLGGVPKIPLLLAKCTAVGGDAGYAQNEVIVLATNGSDAGGSNYGVSMKINSTQIVLRVGNGSGNSFTNYPHATTGVINGLDYTKWVLIVRAYA